MAEHLAEASKRFDFHADRNICRHKKIPVVLAAVNADVRIKREVMARGFYAIAILLHSGAKAKRRTGNRTLVRRVATGAEMMYTGKERNPHAHKT